MKTVFQAIICVLAISALSCKKNKQDNQSSDSGSSTPLPYCDSNLVLRLDFNGNTYDSSCSRQNAILNTGIYVLDRNNNTNRALRLSGIMGENVSISGNSKTRIGFPFSVSFWVNPTDSSKLNEIISSGTPNSGFKISISSGKISCEFANGLGGSSNYRSWTANQNILSNRWTHVTVTFSGTSTTPITIYIDGTNFISAFGSGAGTTIAYLSGDKLSIGPKFMASSVPASIKIDKVKIWKKILSNTEVVAEYNALD